MTLEQIQKRIAELTELENEKLKQQKERENEKRKQENLKKRKLESRLKFIIGGFYFKHWIETGQKEQKLKSLLESQIRDQDKKTVREYIEKYL